MTLPAARASIGPTDASWLTLDVADGDAVVIMMRPPVNAMSRAFMADPTEDAREGIRAFLEKRPARFRGR